MIERIKGLRDMARKVSSPRNTLAAAFAAATLAMTGGVATAAGGGHDAPKIERQSWTFGGPFGYYDQAQLRRGFQVYSSVCAACHPMNLVSYRNLAQPGGLGFTDAEVKALAAQATVKDGTLDSNGKLVERPGRPSDHFPSPYVNADAAREIHNGAVPPDFSVLAKARTYSRGFPMFLVDALIQYQEHGPDYIVALLKGYEENAPEGVKLLSGQYYNHIMPGNVLSMAPPLSDGAVDYTDPSVPKTLDQYAKDVAAFMMWAAEPKLEQRKNTGLRVMIFLAILTSLLYLVKRKLWSSVYPH
jgi:ubiquinol-cytochrome c reductase cytochrome b/c1 subunit